MSAPTSVPADEVHALREEMMLLAYEYAQWPQNQPPEWSPKTVGFAGAAQEDENICWPGKVETYFDRESTVATFVTYNQYR